MAKLAVGAPMPDFTARVTDGETIGPFRLADFVGRGPIVLATFPLAFTSTCEAQLCDLRDHATRLDALAPGVQLFGLSADSPQTLRVWHGQERFGYPLLSDWNGSFREATGLVYPFPVAGLEGTIKRTAIVLDADGTVTYLWEGDDPDDAPDVDAIAEALARLGA